MTLKKYLRPEEAAKYLTNKTNSPTSVLDVSDLVFEKQILAVIKFQGAETICKEDTESDTPRYVKETYPIIGYFSHDHMYMHIHRSNYVDDIDSQFYIYECEMRVGRPTKERGEPVILNLMRWPDPPEGWEEVFRTRGYYDWDSIYIPRAELDALIAKHQADSTPPPAPVAAAEPAPQQTEAPPEALSAKASALPAELAAVLDPTHPDHAPDLAEAIRLWLALYGGETTKHSHSNACGHWMKAQGISDSFIDSTAGRRIKEVTSPQRAWDAQRKERHASRKKQD